MPILNYTTSISAQKTVGEITSILASHRAKAVLMNYDNEGQIESLSFQIATPQGDMGIRLPVDPTAVLKVMARQGVTTKYLNRAHATRVAWRIIKNWVTAQMALLTTQMVSISLLQQLLIYTTVVPFTHPCIHTIGIGSREEGE